MSDLFVIDRRVRPEWRDRRSEGRTPADAARETLVQRSPGRRSYDLRPSERAEAS